MGQVMAYAQVWSAAHGVNLIMCNAYGEPSDCGGHKGCGGESGSGIFASGSPVSSYYDLKAQSAVLRVAEIPKKEALQSSPGALARPLARFKATNWKFLTLAAGKVCSGSLCCEVTSTSGLES